MNKNGSRRRSRRTGRRRMATLVALTTLVGTVVLAAAVAAGASIGAHSVTYPDGNGGSATVTLDATSYAPEAKIDITGQGFLGSNGQGGMDVVIKLDDDKYAVAAWGGTDAITSGVTADGSQHAAFSSEANGTFSGWVQLPSDLPTGPHYLRVLAGSYGNTGAAMTFQASFTVANPTTPTTPTSSTPATTSTAPAATTPVTTTTKPPGSGQPSATPVSSKLLNDSVAAGSLLRFTLSGYKRASGGGQHVGLKLDDDTIIACVLAKANGSYTGSVKVPATLKRGTHTIRFLGGTDCVSIGDGGTLSEPPAHTSEVTFVVTKAAPYATFAAGGKTVRVTGGRVALKLAGHAGDGRARVSIVSAGKLCLGGTHKPAVITMTKTKLVALAAGQARTVRLSLTRAGTWLLAHDKRVLVRARVSEGKRSTTKVLSLRLAK